MTQRPGRPVACLALFLFALLAALAVPPGLAADEPLPDLVVVDLRVDEGQRGHMFIVEVRNDGGAFGETLRVAVTDVAKGSGIVVFAEPVPPGATRNVTLSHHTWYYGDAVFRVTLDRWNAIAEANETNNILESRHSFGTPALSVVGFGPETPMVVDAPLPVGVRVKNEGNGTAYDVPVRVTDADGNHSTGSIARIPPGATGKGIVHWWVPREEAIDVTATVDPDAAIPDADRTDNHDTGQLGPAAPGQPVTLSAQQLWSNLVEEYANTTQYVIDYYGTFSGDHVPTDARAVLFDGDDVVASKTLGLKWQNGTITEGVSYDSEGLSWYPAEEKGVYTTTTFLKFHHTVASDHTPAYALEIQLEPDRPWNVTFRTDDIQPAYATSEGGGGGGGAPPDRPAPPPPPPPPPPAYDEPDPRLELGPKEVYLLDGEVRVNAEATFGVEIVNPHTADVTVDLHWAFERTYTGLSQAGWETITVPPGTTVATFETMFGPASVTDHALVATLLEPGTPFSQLPPPSVYHDQARMPLAVAPPRDHLQIDPEVEQRPTPTGTLFFVQVQATELDARMTRLVILDDGGHFVRVDAFPVDIPAGQVQTFSVNVERRDGNASGQVVVQAVSVGSESPPITLYSEYAAQSDLEISDPTLEGGGVIVIVLVGSGTMGALGAALVWANEARRFELLRRILQSGLGLALFSRIQGAKTLEHGTREEIHRLVSERPGVHYREILRTLRLSNGSLAHHLQTLEREGILRSQKDGRLMRFFATRATSRVGQPLTPRQLSILSHVRRRPGVLQSELAKRLGVSRQALHQQVTGLREAGLLMAETSGRSNALYLEADVDRRVCSCAACDTRYDRGGDPLEETLCPGCGAV